MVLGSAVAFGTLSILAKLAYSAGLGTNQLLAFRFVVAGAGMWLLAFAIGQNPLRLKRRQVINVVGLGSVVYTAQALTYFLALRSLPASLCVLIVYIYPSLVVLAGWLFLHRAVSPWHGVALVSSFAGVALLVGGAQFRLAWALVLVFASPVMYTMFIFLGERVMADVPAVAASAVMFSSTAVVFCFIAVLGGQLSLPANTSGWLVGFAIAVIPTMVAISLFLAGLPRIGASRAALLSTLEPVVTVLLAVVLLGDRFSALQVVGGVLVLVAVIVVQAAHLWRPGPQAALR